MRSPRRRCSLLLLAWLFAMAAPTAALADGGALVRVADIGEQRISIFVAPNPLRAGPIDVSVLVQRDDGGEVIHDAEIAVALRSVEAGAIPVSGPATHDAATNKLLQSAWLELNAPGRWQGEVVCSVEGQRHSIPFTIEAGPPLPAWASLWAWFLWPVGAIFLFAAHRTLAARQRAMRRARKSREQPRITRIDANRR